MPLARVVFLLSKPSGNSSGLWYNINEHLWKGGVVNFHYYPHVQPIQKGGMSMSWKLIHKGKVRDIYVNETLSLIALVATDRVSAFDSVLPVLIKGKGEILTSISNFYAIMTSDIPNAYIWGSWYHRRILCRNRSRKIKGNHPKKDYSASIRKYR